MLYLYYLHHLYFIYVRRQREGKKATGLISEVSSSHVQHAFWYISLPSLHDHEI